jgi:serine/threonine-protein kinase
MSPEQLAGRPIDYRSDIWALGVILYRFLTGHFPFDGDDPMTLAFAVATRAPTPLENYRPEVPLELRRAVRRALAKDPLRRYPNVIAFAKAILPFATIHPPELLEERMQEEFDIHFVSEPPPKPLVVQARNDTTFNETPVVQYNLLMRARRRRRAAIAVGVLIATLGLGTGALVLKMRSERAPSPEQISSIAEKSAVPSSSGAADAALQAPLLASPSPSAASSAVTSAAPAPRIRANTPAGSRGIAAVVEEQPAPSPPRAPPVSDDVPAKPPAHPPKSSNPGANPDYL